MLKIFFLIRLWNIWASFIDDYVFCLVNFEFGEPAVNQFKSSISRFLWEVLPADFFEPFLWRFFSNASKTVNNGGFLVTQKLCTCLTTISKKPQDIMFVLPLQPFQLFELCCACCTWGKLPLKLLRKPKTWISNELKCSMLILVMIILVAMGD